MKVRGIPVEGLLHEVRSGVAQEGEDESLLMAHAGVEDGHDALAAAHVKGVGRDGSRQVGWHSVAAAFQDGELDDAEVMGAHQGDEVPKVVDGLNGLSDVEQAVLDARRCSGVVQDLPEAANGAGRCRLSKAQR